MAQSQSGGAEAPDDDDVWADDEEDGESGKKPASKAPASEDASPAEPQLSPRQARLRARRLFRSGQKQVRNKQYDQGIAAIEAAYELDPRVEHLYNLGAAHHLKGDHSKALDYYRRVISDGGPRRLVQVAERFVVELEREVAAAEQAEALRKAESSSREARREIKKNIEARRVSERQLKETRADLEAMTARASRAEAERDRWQAIAEVRGGGRGKRVFGAFMMLVGGVGAGGGLAYRLVADQADSELDDLSADAEEARPGLERIEGDADDRFLVLTIAGGTLFVIGATVYLLGERDARRTPEFKPRGKAEGKRSAGLIVVPALGPDSAGLLMRGEF
ncbi:MAG: tetratricopeptide repeat protein [Myxococcota bacterium]